MLSQHSFRPYQETRYAPGDRAHTVASLHSPRKNGLLAALPDADYERLLPNLVPVPLPLGLSLHGANDTENDLYFLTSGIVSRSYVFEGGATAGYSITGREGVIGIACFLGGNSTPGQAEVLSAGYAYRLGMDALRREFDRVGALTLLLLRFTHALITQTTMTAVCNRHHSVEQQLCSRILACLDRLASPELVMTQDLLANLLGVRRESITEAARTLQMAGLIHYRRGHIAVLDRTRIAGRACECYAEVKREYARLLPGRNDEQRVYSGWGRAAQW